MARIDVALAGNDGDHWINASMGDTVVIAFNSGPNAGIAQPEMATSAGSGLRGQLYGDTDLTQKIGPASGATGDAYCRIAVGQKWHGYTMVALNTPLWFAVDVLSTDQPGPGAYVVSLKLPYAPKSGDATPPHRGGHHK